ncbi:hypothetical protein WA556_002426 [Blastocystis sp. ATCC 50177/Nand II]
MKQRGESDTEAVYLDCIHQLLHTCDEKGITCLYVKVVNRREDGIRLLNKTMQLLVEKGIHLFPVTDRASQPSSKTRRPALDTHRRRYHKDSHSQSINSEVQSWRSVVVECDAIAKVYLEKKNQEALGNQRFIISTLSSNSLFIKTDKEAYVRSLINEWIDMNNTPKKDKEEQKNGRD